MNEDQVFVRVGFEEMKSVFLQVLLRNGFSQERALKCAEIFAVNSLEGVISHGVNRFPRFINNVKDGFIIPSNDPVLINRSGSLEQWDGQLGPGPLNAIFATDRVVEIAGKTGIGLVALSNTNHWMRAGYYGWKTAAMGFFLIAWTNTEANMPAWGASDARLGNNPMVFAIPDKDRAVVLDFAMTQFSYGKMESYAMAGEKLPFAGGFDKNGELSNDPARILETRRTLPIGYWKGAGLSLILDLLAALLSGGRSVNEITRTGTEHALSQVFIAIDPKHLANYETINNTISSILSDYRQSVAAKGMSQVRYPGENIAKIREENLQKGIPVLKDIWQKVMALNNY